MEQQTQPPPRRARSGRPSLNQSEEIERRILETATKLFSEQGYAATSVKQVATACKAGKDTIYRRFPSKEALFKSVVEHAGERALAALAKAVPAKGDAVARLRTVARWLLDANLEPDLVALKRIAFSELVVFGANVGPAGSDDPLLKRVIELVVEAQNEGKIIAGDPAFIADQLVYCITAKPSVYAMLAAGDFASETARAQYFDRAWDLFLRGAAA